MVRSHQRQHFRNYGIYSMVHIQCVCVCSNICIAQFGIVPNNIISAVCVFPFQAVINFTEAHFELAQNRDKTKTY